MSPDPKLRSAAQESEPTFAPTTMPIWLLVLLLTLLFLGAWYFDARGGWFEAKVYGPYHSAANLAAFQPPKVDGPPGFDRGRAVYGLSCAPCHQPTGMGSAAVGAPPLVGSEWVLAEGPNRLVRIVLNGLSGPITVKDQAYGSGIMTPFKDGLSDEDIAAVLTYIRTNPEWKHNAAPVTPAEVKAIRDATKERGANWTAAELLNVPVK